MNPKRYVIIWPIRESEPLHKFASEFGVGFDWRRDRLAKTKNRVAMLLCFLFLVTHPGIEPEFPAWEASVLTAWPMGHVLTTCILYHNCGELSSLFWKKFQKNYFSSFCAKIRIILVEFFVFMALNRRTTDILKERLLDEWLSRNLSFECGSARNEIFYRSCCGRIVKACSS